MRQRKYTDLEVDFWPSFADVLLSAILVLIFVVSLLFVSQAGLSRELTVKEKAMQDLSKQLVALEKSLQLSSDKSAMLQGELDATFGLLDKSRTELNATREQLGGSLTGLVATQANLQDAITRLNSVESQNQASSEQIKKLSDSISEYLKQVQILNEQLGATKKQLSEKDASLADLNNNVKALSDQVSRLNNELGSAQTQVNAQKLELSKLLSEVENRDKEIARLKSFEQYRSEFLAKLKEVFAGIPDIKAVGDRFVFQGEVLFPSGVADLSDEGKQVLTKFVTIYKSLENRIPADSGLNIQIQGHTDTDPINTSQFPSNWELSSARATRVVSFLSQLGIPQSRLSSAGYSEYYPAAPGATPEAKRQNRRIEIFFTRR